jgi:NAD kinase
MLHYNQARSHLTFYLSGELCQRGERAMFLVNNSYIFSALLSLCRVLVLAKPDNDIMPQVGTAISYLHAAGIEIVVEEQLIPVMQQSLPRDRFVPVEVLSTVDTAGIDLIVTFGGDGLLLHCNSLFGHSSIPPVMSFDFGSLGFLSPFTFESFEKEVRHLLAVYRPHITV